MWCTPCRLAIADIAYQNKAVIYDLLFKASAETMLTIAADPKHLGARIGIISVLHTWGSALTHHPHVHMIVPGGGISLDGTKWISCRPRYFLPVRVLSACSAGCSWRCWPPLIAAGQLQFFGDHAQLADKAAFAAYLAPLRKIDWVVYARTRSPGPRQVLRYLPRYTHRIAISNRRLLAADENGVTFKYKDYRIEGPARYKTMTLATDEFIRRFLMHVLPSGFHRIRYYGLLASAARAAQHRASTRTARAAIAPDRCHQSRQHRCRPNRKHQTRPCPCCGGRMIIIETFAARLLAALPPDRARAPQSGSIPHDAVTTDRQPQPHSPLLLALGRQRPGSRQTTQIGRQSCRQSARATRALRSFTPPSIPVLRGRPIAATASHPTSLRLTPRQNPHSARCTVAPHRPRFRALALFGRRPPECVDSSSLPASENLHKLRTLRQTYSITSSARASSVGGMSRPSALAVLRLMTSSNLVGCSTGKSAGFAPRRICRHSRRRAGTGPGSLVHRTSDLPLRRTPENCASSAVARPAPRC